MYALLANHSSAQSLGIFYTADAHAATPAWQAKSTTNYCAAQCWYNMTGAVDPTNTAHLIVGGQDDYISTNTGGTINQVSWWYNSGSTFSHADHHRLVMPSPTTLYDANDGGFFIGTINWTTPSSTTWVNKNSGLNTLQFYGFSQHPTDWTKIQGGLQDNGNFYFNGTSWLEVYGGDGGALGVGPVKLSYAYEEYVYADIQRNSNMTGTPSSWTCIQNIGGCTCGSCVPDGGRCAFIAPYVLDANDQNTIYAGASVVYKNSSARTTTSSTAWTSIGGNPTNDTSNYIMCHSFRQERRHGGNPLCRHQQRKSVRHHKRRHLLDRRVHRIVRGHRHQSFTTDPTNGLYVLVTVSGYGTAQVYRSTTGATAGTWTDITGALPAQSLSTRSSWTPRTRTTPTRAPTSASTRTRPSGRPEPGEHHGKPVGGLGPAASLPARGRLPGGDARAGRHGARRQLGLQPKGIKPFP